MRYRPEIDGIRAVAVLMVALYHAGFIYNDTLLFQGGFLGVDVFFVISGFLITHIIQNSILKNTFSFKNFYERRARRILPTLFAIMLTFLPFAWFEMRPKALVEFANSILSSLFFSSNINFLFEDSYTAESSLFKPFLHTWSLSVEEQFYLFFPVLLIFLNKLFKNRLSLSLWTLLLCSFASAVYSSIYHPESSFFLIHTRSWELLAGSLIAVASIKNLNTLNLFSKSVSAIMPPLGLIMIAASTFMFNDKMQHPSFITIFPVLGTVLVIHYAKVGSLTTTLLSLRPLVGIGLLSYSFYLWHVPVLAFSRIMNKSTSNIELGLLLAISLALSLITYYLIEQPFRKSNRINNRIFKQALSLSFFILISFSLFVIIKRGVPSRLGFLGTVLEKSIRRPLKQNFKNCSNRKVKSSCVFTNSKGIKNESLISIGDSHGAALATNLKKLSTEQELTFIEMTKSNCPYAPGAFVFNKGHLDKRCRQRQKNLKSFLMKQKPSFIIYNAKLNMYWEGNILKENDPAAKGGGVLLTQSLKGIPDAKGASAKIKESIEDLLSLGHKVILIYPVPEPGFMVLERIKKMLIDLNQDKQQKVLLSLNLNTPYSRYKERSKLSFKVYDSIGQHSNLFRIYPDKIFCSDVENICLNHKGNDVYYYDDNHLSPTAAKLLTEEIKRVVFK